MKIAAYIGGLVVCLQLFAATAQAQFHQKTKEGATQMNKQVVATAQQAMINNNTALTSGGGKKAEVAANPYSTMYLNDYQREKFDARLVEQDAKPISLWGRAIHHSDGSYTESVSEPGNQVMQQETKKNGTLLQRRIVNLDQFGNAKEVLIYDGRDNFKYRGVLLYDSQRRFQEEQLFDAKGTLIRRKVQEYDAEGNKESIKSVDYVENVPDDLKLVITREAEHHSGNHSGRQSGNAQSQARQAGGNADGSSEKMSSKLGRFFGNRKKQ